MSNTSNTITKRKYNISPEARKRMSEGGKKRVPKGFAKMPKDIHEAVSAKGGRSKKIPSRV